LGKRSIIFTEDSENQKNVKFGKLNILENNENRELAIKNGVMSTPTLMFFCKGKTIETKFGFQNKDQLNKLLKNMLKKAKEC
jgi:thioredoxin-related protein